MINYYNLIWYNKKVYIHINTEIYGTVIKNIVKIVTKLCTDSSLISSLSCSEIESNCEKKKPAEFENFEKICIPKVSG